MKKLGLLALAAVLLAGCNAKEKTATETPESTELPAGILQQEAKQQTRTFSQVVEGQHQSQTITYLGDQYVTVDIVLEQDIDEELKNQMLNFGDVEEAKRQVLENTREADPAIAQLEAMSGVTYTMSITEEMRFRVETSLLMPSVNLEELSKVEQFKVLAGQLNSMTPENYILNLLANGYTENQ